MRVEEFLQAECKGEQGLRGKEFSRNCIDFPEVAPFTVVDGDSRERLNPREAPRGISCHPQSCGSAEVEP